MVWQHVGEISDRAIVDCYGSIENQLTEKKHGNTKYQNTLIIFCISRIKEKT